MITIYSPKYWRRWRKLGEIEIIYLEKLKKI